MKLALKPFLPTRAFAATCAANDIRVLVWDEQRPQQKERMMSNSSARPSRSI